MIYLLSSVVFVAVLATVQALRDQHLVLLRWDVASFLLERGADGRYTIVPPARAPLALYRYVRLVVRDLAQRARRRLRARIHLPAVSHSR